MGMTCEKYVLEVLKKKRTTFCLSDAREFVASSVQVEGMLSSPPPTPDQLRSIQHVCKRKECHHPPHTRDQLRSIQHVCKCKGMLSLSPTSCVASNMCASARNVIIPPPPLTSCVASNMCASARTVIIPPDPPLTSCVASNMCAK